MLLTYWIINNKMYFSVRAFRLAYYTQQFSIRSHHKIWMFPPLIRAVLISCDIVLSTAINLQTEKFVQQQIDIYLLIVSCMQQIQNIFGISNGMACEWMGCGANGWRLSKMCPPLERKQQSTWIKLSRIVNSLRVSPVKKMATKIAHKSKW